MYPFPGFGSISRYISLRSNLQLIVYLGKVGMPLASLMVWNLGETSDLRKLQESKQKMETNNKPRVCFSPFFARDFGVTNFI